MGLPTYAPSTFGDLSHFIETFRYGFQHLSREPLATPIVALGERISLASKLGELDGANVHGPWEFVFFDSFFSSRTP